MIRSRRCVSSLTMPQVALARRRIELQLRHRERFDVAAHRRQRRHQFVRHVREQLTARLIGGFERARAARQLVGHLVERSRERRPPRRRRDPGARAIRSPAPSRSVASCTPFSRRRAGPNTKSAISGMPTTEHAGADHRHGRSQLA